MNTHALPPSPPHRSKAAYATQLRARGIYVRQAALEDEAAIRSLVLSERMNPNNLDARNFVVAEEAGRLVGAAQIRPHTDGARELGSLVIAASHRGNGILAASISTALVDALLGGEAGAIFMITNAAHAGLYKRRGFMAVQPSAAPASIRWNYTMGRLGGILSLLKGRSPKRLAIFCRPQTLVAQAASDVATDFSTASAMKSVPLSRLETAARTRETRDGAAMVGMDRFRDTVTRFGASANALAAIGAALDARMSGVALDPAVRPHIDGVLSALDLEAALGSMSEADIRPLLGQLRVFALTNRELLFSTTRGFGWSHEDPAILEAAGDVSSGFAARLKTAIAPALDGLEDRLSAPDAAFLEIGVGIGVVATEIAALWPSLRIVGIDPLTQALSIARQRIEAARLGNRVELRLQAGEDLTDAEAFDLGWLPSVFISNQVISVVLDRVHAALRPGGWLLFPMMRPVGDPLADALTGLRIAMFGGYNATQNEAETLLRGHGFVDVRTLPAPPNALTCLVAGRRKNRNTSITADTLAETGGYKPELRTDPLRPRK